MNVQPWKLHKKHLKELCKATVQQLKKAPNSTVKNTSNKNAENSPRFSPQNSPTKHPNQPQNKAMNWPWNNQKRSSPVSKNRVASHNMNKPKQFTSTTINTQLMSEVREARSEWDFSVSHVSGEVPLRLCFSKLIIKSNFYTNDRIEYQKEVFLPQFITLLILQLSLRYF